MNTTVTPTIKAIGADDPNQLLFENQYVTPRGMSYNSYLVEGEKIAVLDTSDASCASLWLANLEAALDGRRPDYLVAHHLEPDHSSAIVEAMHSYPEMVLVSSAKGLAMVSAFFDGADFGDRTMAVGDGDEIDLGGRSLKVFTAPFVHWPEVIMTYDTADKVLFSADGFGKFGALQYDDAWLPEARRYYCNIVGKYGVQVQNVLKKVAGVEIDIVAPLHGPVLAGAALAEALDAYGHWSTWTPECEGVLVAYASVYGSTARAALEAARLLRLAGKGEVVTMDICRCDVAEAVAQAFRLSRAVFASVTYDGSLFPPMYNFLHRLGLKGWRGRRVGLIQNGSWAPAAAKLMTGMLAEMKDIEMVEPVVTLRSALHEADREAIGRLVEAL